MSYAGTARLSAMPQTTELLFQHIEDLLTSLLDLLVSHEHRPMTVQPTRPVRVPAYIHVLSVRTHQHAAVAQQRCSASGPVLAKTERVLGVCSQRLVTERILSMQGRTSEYSGLQ
jgi:hypothetical protein